MDKFSHIESSLEPSFIMKDINQSILIFDGSAKLILSKENSIDIEVKCFLEWMPNTNIELHFELDNENTTLLRDAESEGEFKLEINHNEIKECYIYKIDYARSNRNNIIVGTNDNFIIGDNSIEVDEVKFSLVNVPLNIGSNVLRNNISVTKYGRLLLSCEKYNIQIDQLNVIDIYKDLARTGGKLITHIGSIKKKKGSLSFEEVHEQLNLVSSFFSLLTGRRVRSLFIEGMSSDGILAWKNYSNYDTASYINVKSLIASSIGQINLQEIWQGYTKITSDNNDIDTFVFLIDIYVSINANLSINLNNSIILAQTTLELLYNWWVIDKRNLFGKKGKDMEAVNKIRLLVSFLDIGNGYKIPSELSELVKYVSANSIEDAPEAIVSYRNKLVHAKSDSIEKINDIPAKVRYEIVQIALWYIELSILKIIDYQGAYRNRWSNEPNLEYVPWKKD